jgi:beta-xylosidase
MKARHSLGLTTTSTTSLLLAVAVLLASCAQVAPTGTQETDASMTPTIAAGQMINPLIGDDFPDPHVLRVDDGWLAFATGSPGFANIQVARSDDFSSWEMLEDALPERPSWQPIQMGLTWAPDVTRVGDRFLMLYVARHQASGLQCLSRAWADAPAGPYIDDSSEPFLCQDELGGTIDPHLFVDNDGTKWLYFKNDGNAVGVETVIWAARVDEDGDLLEPAADTGLRNFRSWHGAVVEAPAVWRFGDSYVMTYSANDYGSDAYAVGWAVSSSPAGPWEDKSLDPLIATAAEVSGPGGQQIFVDDDGQPWLAYHAWTTGLVGYNGDPGHARSFRIDPLRFQAGELTLVGPSTSVRQAPVTK